MDYFGQRTSQSNTNRNVCVKFEGNQSTIVTTRVNTYFVLGVGIGTDFTVQSLRSHRYCYLNSFPTEIC